jgi:hypothetical protein
MCRRIPGRGGRGAEDPDLALWLGLGLVVVPLLAQLLWRVFSGRGGL